MLSKTSRCAVLSPRMSLSGRFVFSTLDFTCMGLRGAASTPPKQFELATHFTEYRH